MPNPQYRSKLSFDSNLNGENQSKLSFKGIKMRLASVICLVVLAVLLASGTEAVVSRGIFKDPNHPGKCVVDGLVLNAGQKARHPNWCERIFCEKNGEVEFHSCVGVVPPPNKKFGDYKTPNADYPDCCDRYIINA